MADGELNVAIVPDEDALEEIEEKQLEISGEPGAVGEAKELNESQDQKLGIVNRKLGRITTRLGQLGLIAVAIAALSKIVGEIFDIGFEDVRNAIVQAINLLIDTVKSFFPGGNRSSAPTAGEITGSYLPGLLTGGSSVALGSLLASRMGSISDDRSGGNNSDSNGDTNVVTSREMLLGDSTFREMSSERSQSFIIEGGSE